MKFIAPLSTRMSQLAERHPRYGYRRVWALLRSEGWLVNRKRIERLWRLEGHRVPPRSAVTSGAAQVSEAGAREGGGMTTLALSVAPPRERTGARLAYQVGVALAGSLLVAGLAQVSIKLPFTPVPITGQTLGVLLVGAALGPGLGALSMALYLLEGAIGLPFFAEGRRGADLLGLASATGGYLWGFLLAGLVVGWLSRRGWERSIRSAIGAMLIGNVVIYGAGVPWLMAALDVGLQRGLEWGLYPFVIGDTLKLLVAAGILPAAWRVVGRERPEAPERLG